MATGSDVEAFLLLPQSAEEQVRILHLGEVAKWRSKRSVTTDYASVLILTLLCFNFVVLEHFLLFLFYIQFLEL